MKRTILTSLSATLFIAVAGWALGLQVMAQNPQYKEGDRVEVDVIMASNPANAIWKKGTIIKVDLATAMAYTVQVDPLPGKLPQVMLIPIRPYAEGWLRRSAGVAPQIESARLRVDNNDTVLADRELLDCSHLKHDGRNGSPLPPELAKQLIRCLYEKPSPVGQDGATTMDITEFSIGTPRRWVLYQDMGQGSANTLVYPVHVKWNMRTFYRTRNVVTTGKEAAFTCFADNTNLWQCGTAAGPHQDGKTQEIMVKK